MTPLPKKEFRAILADPPWHFDTWSIKGRDRSPDSKHYPTMSTREIVAINARQCAADDCALFLWATWPMLNHALYVMRAWGFEYKTCAFAWMKTNPNPYFDGLFKLSQGTGYWTRANTEVCLLGTKGNPKRRRADVAQAILEPRREHSRKPDCIYKRIEALVPGPYLELFARQRRNGWTSWGNEVDKFGGQDGKVKRLLPRRS